MRGFMWYVIARFKRESELERFRTYVADALYCASRPDICMSSRWREPHKPTDDRTAEEIAEQVAASLGLEMT